MTDNGQRENRKTMKKIAIFASGKGSNARKIIEYFEDNENVDVRLIVSNKKNAGVLDMGPEFVIPTKILSRKEFYDTQTLVKDLKTYEIDLIVLAGFLWLIPDYLVRNFRRKIINIHPALLPKYGGKGMYGMNVHEAVHAAQEKESGITIHFVNNEYDKGAVIFQESCAIFPSDRPQDIADKVLKLEHQYFPRVIGKLLTENT